MVHGKFFCRRLMNPMSTIRTPKGMQDKVLLEAQNLSRLEMMPTPLLGGENPKLNESLAESDKAQHVRYIDRSCFCEIF